MSVQAALEFLKTIRRSPGLQAALAGVEDHERLAQVARDAGFACRADEIAQAFGLECAFRQAAHRIPSEGYDETRGDQAC